MSTAESPLRPLAWAIVFAASAWLVISGSELIAGAERRYDGTGMVVIGIGLLTGLVALLNINSGRWVDKLATPDRKNMTPE